MSEHGDLKAAIDALTKNVALMQSSIQANAKAIADITSSSSGAGPRSHSGEHPQDRPPKHWRPEFPRYDGKTDPLIFINKCESFFLQQRIMPEERVWMASYNLNDVAQLWYMQVQEDEGTPNWPRFKDLLNLRFGPPLRSAPLFELSSCRRTGTVTEYQDQWQALLPRAGKLDEAQRIQLFTGGLQPPLSLQVQMQNPQSLASAMSLARQFELLAEYTGPPAPAAPARAPARGLLGASLPLLALPAPPPPAARAPAAANPAANAGAANPGDGRQAKRLSREEQAERRRLGLCYNCNEPYSRGHNRVCRRIFHIAGVELDDDDNAGHEEPATESPVFSLHAVAGVAALIALLDVSLGRAALIALLDSGSTHNFISAGAAERTGLVVEPRPRLTAVVANGERVSCPGVIRAAPVSIDGTIFHIDLFVMPLAGYDVVLGTQWMATLGPIVWDFAAPSMAFQLWGRSFHWTGVLADHAPRLHSTAASTSLLDELLATFDDVFAEPTGSLHRAHATTTSSSSRTRRRWPFAHTATRRLTRTNSSGNAPP
jgi:hypothetical protein